LPAAIRTISVGIACYTLLKVWLAFESVKKNDLETRKKSSKQEKRARNKKKKKKKKKNRRTESLAETLLFACGLRRVSVRSAFHTLLKVWLS